ncbi:hypothetical protein CEXT_91111 [Caerostris extrusa]|uniref:Uncharacterized protein n=1 Tax=Caerostris extrusa TaxID=172846 RepID=A0AAV4R350_CAEEX|nr:hypothetical protein CEXT_91111 [Caerostris extrusa]
MFHYDSTISCHHCQTFAMTRVLILLPLHYCSHVDDYFLEAMFLYDSTIHAIIVKRLPHDVRVLNTSSITLLLSMSMITFLRRYVLYDSTIHAIIVKRLPHDVPRI